MIALTLPFPDIGPNIFAFEVMGREIALRWYAMSYIVGIVIGWWMGTRLLKREVAWPRNEAPMTSEALSDLITWIILGVVLGGRLGFVLFYQPAYYAQNPGEILQIWQGGMSFHGGALGVLLAGLVFCWRNRISPLSTGDLIVVCTPPALLLGRLANFINAELWGRPTDVPWAVIFPGQHAQDCGQALGQLCARHPSQLYEALLEGLILGGLLLWLAWRRNAFKMPGLMCGTFLAGYGIARSLVEFFRQPDSQFQSVDNPLGLALHVGGYGLTMGQILSLPMIAIGLWLVLRARRQIGLQTA